MSILHTPKTIGEVLSEALDRGCNIDCQHGRIEIPGPKDAQIYVVELQRRHAEIEPLLRPGPGEFAEIDGHRIRYSVWSGFEHWPGEQLGPCIGVDTETELIQPGKIPRLVMVSASDGDQHMLIHPCDIGAFVKQHNEAIFCFHNVAFDFLVLHQTI